MEFYGLVGKVALGSRLRRLNERLIEDSSKVYGLYGVELDPKWFPVFFLLSRKGESSITEIANDIGQTHPSVSQVVKEMKRRGIVTADKHEKDRRVTRIKLTDRGRQLVPALEQQCRDVTQAIEEMLSVTRHNLWTAIQEFEFLLAEKNLFDRIRTIRKTREMQAVEIVDYSSEFQADFERINGEWIRRYFEMEQADRDVLSDPETSVLKPGGHIVMARYGGEIVGTCALIKLNDDTYELAKMAVTDSAKGLGIGTLLGRTVIERARELGARSVCLESNTGLSAAMALYAKLGFRKTVGPPSPYARCNIQMKLDLV